MGRSVAADDAGAVDREHHREVLQHHVVNDLVVGALEKRRVDPDDGLQPLAGKARGEGHAVLLGDRDVEVAIGIELLEPFHPRALAHRGGDRDEPLVPLRHVAEPVAEDLGIRRRRRRCRIGHDPDRRIERGSDAVILHRIGLRGGVALALAGDDVQQLRAAKPLEVRQVGEEGAQIVPVDGSDVVEAELLEERAGDDQALDVLLGPARHLVNRRHPAEDFPAALLDRRVEAAREELREPVRERPDIRRDRHLVVVEHDEQIGADPPGVIQRLERHAAGETSVADDRDDLAVAAGELRRDRHARRSTDGSPRVADPERVAGTLVALRKRREPSPPAHRVHPVAPAGEDLVRVALVPHVPDDPVMGRVVEIVERDGELDRAETGREMPAVPGDGLDQIPAKLPGDVAQRMPGQPAEVRRGVDRREQGIVRLRVHVLASGRRFRRARLGSVSRIIIGRGCDAPQGRASMSVGDGFDPGDEHRSGHVPRAFGIAPGRPVGTGTGSARWTMPMVAGAGTTRYRPRCSTGA